MSRRAAPWWRASVWFEERNGVPVPSGMITHPYSVRRTWTRHTFVSTVFLALAHGYIGDKPLLYETMVFRTDSAPLRMRWTTRAEAVRGHKGAVRSLRRNIGGAMPARTRLVRR